MEHSDDGFLALVRVVKARIQSPGTRRSTVVLELAVETPLIGKPDSSVVVRAYGGKEDIVLQEGHRYILTFGPTKGPMQMIFGQFLEVEKGHEAEAVRLHRLALEALQR